MSREVVSVPPSASVRELARVLRRHGVSGVPVVDESGAAVGTVSVSDLLWLGDLLVPGTDVPSSRALDDRTVGEIMTPDVFGVRPDDSLAELGRFFTRTGLRRAVVLEDGRPAGIVSATDLLGYIAEEA